MSTPVCCEYKLILPPQQREEDPVFKLIWSNLIPSKVAAFTWRAILDRVQTKENLHKMRIITDAQDTLCSFCNQALESSTHLLFSCPFTLAVWNLCYGWLGVQSALPNNCTAHLLQHSLPSLS